jgi:hypothetical protein
VNSSSPNKKLFYPVWVSRTGTRSLRWGKPCDSAGEALQLGKLAVRQGTASLAFVVRFFQGEKTPLPTYVYPLAAREVIRHWEELWDATEPSA